MTSDLYAVIILPPASQTALSKCLGAVEDMVPFASGYLQYYLYIHISFIYTSHKVVLRIHATGLYF